MGEDQEEDSPEPDQHGVSLLRRDTAHFITRRMADGNEASFWPAACSRQGSNFGFGPTLRKGRWTIVFEMHRERSGNTGLQ